MVLVQNVSKLYRLYHRPSDRLIEALPGQAQRHSDFWALRNVSFSVAPGEILGLMGPNGSGKSTLLQVVSGILKPTSGRVSVEGRVAALLELGAGFNPEFTGRENVFLNGEIMGLSRSETESIYPEIAKFAEIGEFLDRPVKEYSSGMYVRLAFATAIHVRPDVLIVDEALAVGDAIFANRCLRKLEQLKSEQVTILFVSHDLGLIKRLCHRAILMVKGEIVAEGTPSDVVNRYVGLVHDQQALENTKHSKSESFRHGDGASLIVGIELLDNKGNPAPAIRSGEQVDVIVTARATRDLENPVVGLLIRSRGGIDVFGTNTCIENVECGVVTEGDEFSVSFRLDCLLTRGDYTLTVATQHPDGSSQDWLDDAVQFTVFDHQDLAGLVKLPVQVRCMGVCKSTR